MAFNGARVLSLQMRESVQLLQRMIFVHAEYTVSRTENPSQPNDASVRIPCKPRFDFVSVMFRKIPKIYLRAVQLLLIAVSPLKTGYYTNN